MTNKKQQLVQFLDSSECWLRFIRVYIIVHKSPIRGLFRIRGAFRQPALDKTLLTNTEALPGVLWNKGTRATFSGEQGNKCHKIRGTGEHKQFWGTGNIENQDFVFGEQGHTAIFSRGTREQVPIPPPSGGPQHYHLYHFHLAFKLFYLHFFFSY